MNWDQFQQAIGDRNWLLIAAFVILFIVRVAKLPITGAYWEKVPKQYRPLIPVVLGMLSGVGEALVAKRPWVPALISGLLSGLLAIGADQAITKPTAQLLTAKPQPAVSPADAPPPETTDTGAGKT